MQRTGQTGIKGDDDPLDICVLTEREITHGDIIVKVVPVGGFRLIDNNEADDKIIAVLYQDDVYGALQDVNELPKGVVNRLKHYFLTYKQLPGSERQCAITHTYGKDEALEVIRESQKDYLQAYGNLEEKMSATLEEWIGSGGKHQV
jgi:inorganic pyrophosphatase